MNVCHFVDGFMVYSEQLSSIPGLEEVTVDGLNQQQSVQSNGPVSASQNQSDGVTAGGAPPSQVGKQTQPQTNLLTYYKYFCIWFLSAVAADLREKKKKLLIII